MFIVITSQEATQAFAHPALDLLTGEIIELEAELAPAQLELFDADEHQLAFQSFYSPSDFYAK